MEDRLSEILPTDWQERWETHEEQRDLFSWAFDEAEAIATEAIQLLNQKNERDEQLIAELSEVRGEIDKPGRRIAAAMGEFLDRS
ncbi:MAG: hypothetical protein ACR2RE_31725 [Geminicoccaceae bacterium]